MQVRVWHQSALVSVLLFACVASLPSRHVAYQPAKRASAPAPVTLCTH